MLSNSAAHRDHSRLSTLLFGNPNAETNNSSYQVEKDGIWIEHFFDSPGQQEWFPMTAFNGLASGC